MILAARCSWQLHRSNSNGATVLPWTHWSSPKANPDTTCCSPHAAVGPQVDMFNTAEFGYIAECLADTFGTRGLPDHIFYSLCIWRDCHSAWRRGNPARRKRSRPVDRHGWFCFGRSADPVLAALCAFHTKRAGSQGSQAILQGSRWFRHGRRLRRDGDGIAGIGRRTRGKYSWHHARLRRKGR